MPARRRSYGLVPEPLATGPYQSAGEALPGDKEVNDPTCKHGGLWFAAGPSLTSRSAGACGQGEDWQKRWVRQDTDRCSLSLSHCRSSLKEASGCAPVR